jgi:hypothetical protein
MRVSKLIVELNELAKAHGYNADVYLKMDNHVDAKHIARVIYGTAGGDEPIFVLEAKAS